MPNVRGRTKKASDDKARDSTPRATGKRKAVATPGPHEIESAEKVPAPKFTVLDDEDEDEEIEQSPLQSKHAVAESTPLPVRLQRRLDPLPGPSNPPKRQLYSPLPPSSPPSMSSDDLEYENAPPVRVRAPPTPDPSEPGDENIVELPNKENEFTETEEEDNVLPVPALDYAAELAPSEESSQDDPFGFTALERRLKSQRAARRHSFEPLPEAQLLGKGKEPMRPRAPLGELSFDRGGASTSTLKDRHPTPYHESDDLEDMYLDPNELALPEPTDDEEDEHAHMRPSTGLEGLEAEMDEEEQAELARELQKRIKEKKEKGKAKEKAKDKVKEQPKPVPVERESSTDDMGDALRTPQPKHVANIYPLRSPFSSVEGTPCDRSLPDSPLSSPSPTKPMAVLHTLPVSSARKGMLSPAKKVVGPRPLVELPGAKRRRITLGKENSLVFESEKSEQEEKVAAAKVLERLLPTVRRSARNTAGAGAATTGGSAFPRSSSVFKSSPVVKRGRGRPRKQAATDTTTAMLDSTPRAIPDTGDYNAPESSPVVTRTTTRKRVAAAAVSSPVVEVKEPAAKKAKTKAKANATSPAAKPTARRGRPPGSTKARSGTKPASRRGKPVSKGKGKGKADVQDDDEDSVRSHWLMFSKRCADLCGRTWRGDDESGLSILSGWTRLVWRRRMCLSFD